MRWEEKTILNKDLGEVQPLLPDAQELDETNRKTNILTSSLHSEIHTMHSMEYPVGIDKLILVLLIFYLWREWAVPLEWGGEQI